MNLIENPRGPTRPDGGQSEGKCRPGEHNYSFLFPDVPVLTKKDGARVVLLFCSSCANARIIDLTALGIAYGELHTP